MLCVLPHPHAAPSQFHRHQQLLQAKGVQAYAFSQFARPIWWESRYGLYFAYIAQPELFQHVRVRSGIARVGHGRTWWPARF